MWCSSAFKATKSSNVVLKTVEVHVMSLLTLDFALFVPLVLSELYLLLMLDTLVPLMIAVGRESTLR